MREDFETIFMNEITIPFHLAIPTLLCLGILLLIFVKRKSLFRESNRKWFWISVIVFLSIYVLIVGDATINDMVYQWDANRYDLNQDGLFGGAEITKEQEAALERLVNDTGRNFSFITGLIFSTIISTVVYVIGKVYEKIR